MKRYLGTLSLVVILLAMTASAFAAAPWGLTTDDGVDLTITRTWLPIPALWEWKFEVVNSGVDALVHFSAGFAHAESPFGFTATGHYTAWATSIADATVTVFEGPGSIVWSDADGSLVANGGGTEWFSYQTDLPYVGLADYQGRDGIFTTPDWDDHAAPTIPEPMSLVLGFMGLGSVAGLKKMFKR